MLASDRNHTPHNMENHLEQQNALLIEREAAEPLEVASISALTTLQAAPELRSQECYICDSSEVCLLKCGHALCPECIQGQIEHLPQKGQRFTTRNAKCGICSSWIEYEGAPLEFARIKEREAALLERLKADDDPDPELPVLLSSGSLLSKWQFMICGDCNETCYAGKVECAPADDEAEPEEAWKCINCLDCDQDFPTNCEAHGDKHIAFKCFFCCNIATFFCGGKTHFCEQCHKHGWGAQPMKIGDHRPGCDGRHPDHGTKKIHCLGCVLCRSLGLNLSTKSAQTKQRLAYIKVKKGLPVSAEEAELAAEQLELDRLEAERVVAEKRAADVEKLMALQLSKSDAEKLLDEHNGNGDAAAEFQRQLLKRQEEQRAREAARDAAVATLRAMGFSNKLEELHSILSSKNNNVEQAIDALFVIQATRDVKVQALVGFGWNEAEVQVALEECEWDQQAAEVMLKEYKHKLQCQYPGQKGYQRRIAKILKSQHMACMENKGKLCSCKGAFPEASPVALCAQSPVSSLRVEDEGSMEVEEFSGAFAMPKKATPAGKQLFPAKHRNPLPVAAVNLPSALDSDSAGDFVMVVGKGRGRSQNERAHAEASESKECGSKFSADCCDNEQDVVGDECNDGAESLVEEFSGAFAKAKPKQLRARQLLLLLQQKPLLQQQLDFSMHKELAEAGDGDA